MLTRMKMTVLGSTVADYVSWVTMFGAGHGPPFTFLSYGCRDGEVFVYQKRTSAIENSNWGKYCRESEVLHGLEKSTMVKQDGTVIPSLS